MTEEKKTDKPKRKVRVVTLKIGCFAFAIRKKIKGEPETHTREQLIAADRYQADFFGYRPLGLRAVFMSRESIRDYLERKFNEQDDIPRTRFFHIMRRQASRKDRIMRRIVNK